MSSPQASNIRFVPLHDDPLLVVFPEDHELASYKAIPVKKLSEYPLIMTYRSYDRDVRRVFREASIEPDVRYYFRDDFAVLSMVRHGIGIAVLPEMIIEKFPGGYGSRPLHPGSFRRLGIGLRSIEEAGPLADFIIKYMKETTSASL